MAARHDRHPKPGDSQNAGGIGTPEPLVDLATEALVAEAEMRSYKWFLHSALLKRMAHADVFEVGTAPRFLFLLFGGSGVDKEEYDRRLKTTIPIFGPVLEKVADCGVSVVMVYVTAPYDVPFNRFATDPSATDTWNAHVLTSGFQDSW